MARNQTVVAALANAVDFDLFSYMLPMLYRRLEKSQESTWITNLKTNATIGVTTTSPTAITYPQLIALEHSLPAAYRSDSCFILADSAYQQIRGLVDNNNRPVLDLDPTNEFQACIHGKPVIVSDYMDAVAATHTVAAYASAGAFLVFDAGLKRLARYILQPSFPDQTGFELFANGDFNFVPAGVRTLVMHA